MKTIFIITGVSLLIIILVVCFFYPYLFNWYIDYYCEKRLPKYDTSTNGTFGDMFGGLNTLFSGLAFVGLIATIFIQIYLHKREIDIDRQKKENEVKEDKIKHVKNRDDKLTYLVNLLNKALENNEIFVENLKEWTINNNKNILVTTRFEYNSTDIFINIITKTIDQEVYFQYYKERFQTNDILEIFNLMNSLLEMKIHTLQRFDAFNYETKEKRQNIAKANNEVNNQIFNFTEPELVDLYSKYLNKPNLNLDELSKAQLSFLDNIESRKKMNDKYKKIIYDMKCIQSEYIGLCDTIQKFKADIIKTENSVIEYHNSLLIKVSILDNIMK